MEGEIIFDVMSYEWGGDQILFGGSIAKCLVGVDFRYIHDRKKEYVDKSAHITVA